MRLRTNSKCHVRAQRLLSHQGSPVFPSAAEITSTEVSCGENKHYALCEQWRAYTAYACAHFGHEFCVYILHDLCIMYGNIMDTKSTGWSICLRCSHVEQNLSSPRRISNNVVHFMDYTCQNVEICFHGELSRVVCLAKTGETLMNRQWGVNDNAQMCSILHTNVEVRRWSRSPGGAGCTCWSAWYRCVKKKRWKRFVFSSRAMRSAVII